MAVVDEDKDRWIIRCDHVDEKSGERCGHIFESVVTNCLCPKCHHSHRGKGHWERVFV